MTSSLETERAILKGKNKVEVNNKENISKKKGRKL